MCASARLCHSFSTASERAGAATTTVTIGSWVEVRQSATDLRGFTIKALAKKNQYDIGLNNTNACQVIREMTELKAHCPNLTSVTAIHSFSAELASSLVECLAGLHKLAHLCIFPYKLALASVWIRECLIGARHHDERKHHTNNNRLCFQILRFEMDFHGFEDFIAIGAMFPNM